MRSEIRHDPIENATVIVAPSRARRPNEYLNLAPRHQKARCVFCPRNISPSLLLATFGDKPWRLAVLKNPYPALSPRFPKAYGHQEVIVETPDPDRQLEDLSIPHITDYLLLLSHRTAAAFSDPKIKYSLIFKNAGPSAGATIHHAHTQLMAARAVPPALVEKVCQIRTLRQKSGACPHCRLIGREAKSPRRILSDNQVVAFAPFVSRFPYEAWIMPRRHVEQLSDLTAPELTSFASALKGILKQISKLGASYNFSLEQVRSRAGLHLCLKVMPRLAIWGGVEVASGYIVNQVPPEQAARYYRRP